MKAGKPKLGSGMTKTGIYINEKITSNWKSKYAKACNAYIQKNFNEMNKEIRQLNESLIRMDADAEKMLAEKDSTIKHLENNIIIPLQKRIVELEKENKRILKNKMLRSDLRGGLLYIAYEEKQKAVSGFVKELENHASVIAKKDMPPFVIKGDMIIAQNWWASMKLKWGIK